MHTRLTWRYHPNQSERLTRIVLVYKLFLGVERFFTHSKGAPVMETCCTVPLTWKDCSEPGADHKIQGAQCSVCKTVYERRNTGTAVYVNRDGKDDYHCATCGSTIQAAKVAHPIHDGPFPLSGSGKCEYENVPYCPQCETQPSLRGSIITPRKHRCA